jgi:hypothetical protein
MVDVEGDDIGELLLRDGPEGEMRLGKRGSGDGGRGAGERGPTHRGERTTRSRGLWGRYSAAPPASPRLALRPPTVAVSSNHHHLLLLSLKLLLPLYSDLPKGQTKGSLSGSDSGLLWQWEGEGERRDDQPARQRAWMPAGRATQRGCRVPKERRAHMSSSLRLAA